MADAKYIRIGSYSIGLQGSSFGNFELNEATDAVEWLFNACNDGGGNYTVTHLGFRYGLRTGTPPTYRISLQGVDLTNGIPNGTVLGGATPAQATFTPPASTAWDGTWQWVALDNAYILAPGAFAAIVIDYSAGTIDASNKSSFTTDNVGYTSLCIFPVAIQNNATSRTRRTNSPLFGYKTASKVYGYPVEGQSSSLPASNLEVGLKFTFDASWGATNKIAGVECGVRALTAAKTARVTLYDTDGTTALQQVDIDTDVFANSSNAGGMTLWFDEVTLSTLTIGSTYYIAIYQVEAGGNFSSSYQSVDAVADWDAHTGGQLFAFVSRATPGIGAWTEEATRRMQWFLILADWTEPASGSIFASPVIS